MFNSVCETKEGQMKIRAQRSYETVKKKNKKPLGLHLTDLGSWLLVTPNHTPSMALDTTLP